MSNVNVRSPVVEIPEHFNFSSSQRRPDRQTWRTGSILSIRSEPDASIIYRQCKSPNIFPPVHPIWNEPKEYYLFEDSIETYWHLSSADFILRILQTGRNNPRAKASAIGKSMGDRYFQAA
jgi:hypothetical protein